MNEETLNAVAQVKDLSPEFAQAARNYYRDVLQEQHGPERPNDKVRWSVRELLTTEFPATRWAVPGLIPEGLSILAGRPKMGKSWLALQIANAVGSGGTILNIPVEQGAVLYLALEDGAKRLQDRLMLQRAQSADIIFVTSYQPLSSGGLTDLEVDLQSRPYRLVVIDTFSRASGGLDDQKKLEEMTVIMSALQRMALKYQVAILLIDHHKKPGVFDADPIDDILGSTGKAAVADSAIGLYRERRKQEATLRVTGRDIPDKELALNWDSSICSWLFAGPADMVRKDSEKGRVLAAIQEMEDCGQAATTTNISQMTGIEKSNVSRSLAELLAEGRVRREQKVGKEQPYCINHDKDDN